MALKQKQTQTAKNERLIAFAGFLKKANGNASSQQEVGSIIKRLGRGDLRKGWKIVDPWLGKSAAEVWKALDRSTQDIVST